MIFGLFGSNCKKLLVHLFLFGTKANSEEYIHIPRILLKQWIQRSYWLAAAGKPPDHHLTAPEVAVQQQHQVLSEENLATQLPRSQSYILFCIGLCCQEALSMAEVQLANKAIIIIGNINLVADLRQMKH
jgi:hypothetical protein